MANSTLLRQNFVMSRLCYSSAEQVTCSTLSLIAKLGFNLLVFTSLATHPNFLLEGSIQIQLAARPNFLLEGVRYNARQKGLRWAVLGRTAHCRHLLLAEVDDPLSQEKTMR